MKILLIIFMFTSTTVLLGQDTIYYDFDENKVSPVESYHYYEIIERDEIDTNKVVVKGYFESEQIKSEMNYNPYSKKKLHGKWKEWYKNGQIKKNIDSKNGKYHGKILTYWSNGKLKREETYIDGEMIEGKCWNSEGKEIKHYDFEIMPEFPGGVKKLFKYLGKHTSYPKKARKNKEEGTVYINYMIDKDGSVTNVRVLRGVSELLDKEAVRVVKNMPKWKPGTQDGEAVRVSFNLPLNFKL